MIAQLAAVPFDVLIVGGGIIGAAVARDAAMRGFKTALVERHDIGSGTSSRSSRLVHGGLRYLEHGGLRLVFESSRERRILMRIARHLVRPLRFTWPVYAGDRVSRWKLRAGLTLYDALSLFGNVTRHRMLGVSQVRATEPRVRADRLVGGATYYDAATDDARLTLAFLRDAIARGAMAANYLAVTELTLRDGTVVGAAAHDAISSRDIRISARMVVNATGPWSDSIRAMTGREGPPGIRGTKGTHIAVRRERVDNQAALTITSPTDGRVMFILPAGRLTIIGTTDTDYAGSLDEVRASPSDIAYLLDAANAYFPEARLQSEDVVSSWAGVRPLVDSAGDPGELSREHAITRSAPGLLSVTGGKLTTSREIGAQVVDAVGRALGEQRPRAPTDRLPLAGGGLFSLESEIALATQAIGDGDTATRLVHAHGSGWRDVWTLGESRPALRRRIHPELPYIWGELVWAIEQEMAMTLSDLLVRRTHLAFELPDHGGGAAPEITQMVAPYLGWEPADVEREIARYHQDIERLFGMSRA
ncbi:MAG TPA: glycerol-3-phosphate dehydrogenase/oxidase [Gemmatimonadaceae bacterium]|nr:glycerol-3-phosphate dehydrogenase/oxidase [Gemmatimonadaceae bacterium]